MPAPKSKAKAAETDAKEPCSLSSSSSEDDLVVEDALASRKSSCDKRDRSRSRSDDANDRKNKLQSIVEDKNGKPKDRSRRDREKRNHNKGLPPGWIRVKSKSKPGTFYYAHPVTNRTQKEMPMDIYAGLEPVRDSSTTPASSLGKPAGPAVQTPADKLKAVAEEAERKKHESEEVRKRAQAEARSKKDDYEEKLRRVAAEERAEEAAREAELQKVRERRIGKSIEAAKVHEEERLDTDRRKASERKNDKGNNRRGIVATTTKQPEPEPPSPSPEPTPPPPDEKELKKAAKEEKKRKALEKLSAKEQKQLKKKLKKEKKMKKQIKKAKKRLKQSEKLLKKVGGGHTNAMSNSSSGSSSSSSSSSDS